MTKPKSKTGFSGSGLNSDEVSMGKLRYEDYLKNYPQLNKLSNIHLLSELVWLESLQERYKCQVGDITKPTRNADGTIKVEAIPRHIQESIANNLESIMNLKSKLGLFEDQKTTDAFKEFENLKKKAAEYRLQNPLSFKCTCFPKGTKISLANREVKNIEDIKIDDEILGIVHCAKKGSKFRTQKVLNFIPQGKKPVIKLTSEHGRELICTPEHRIFASTSVNGTSYKYLPAINCLNKTVKTLFQINYDMYMKGVLLGLLASDGSQLETVDKKHPNWSFETKFFLYQSPKCELETIEEVLKYFNFEYGKSDLVNKSNEFGDGIFTYRIKTKHSEIIKEFQNQLFNSYDMQIGYLAGFILGDGTINQIGNSLIIQKKEIYRIILEKIFKNLGMHYKVLPHGNKGCFTYHIGKQIPLLFKHSQKAIKQNEIFKEQGFNLPSDRIIKIEILKDEQEVFDITTETQNFIANEILVHNCPFCTKIFYLKRKTSNFEEFKSPFYADDKVVKNTPLYKLYKSGKITREEAAEVMGVSPDYFIHLEEKVYTRSKTKDM